jgi:hypothetical protein
MSFWQTFAAANEDAAAAMGEAMVVAGVAITGVVTQPLGVEDGNVPGGKAAIVSGEIWVPASVTPADGMKVTVRGMAARVDSWESQGTACGFLLRLGPTNRAVGGWAG